MPLILHDTLDTPGELGLWRIEEPEVWFMHQLLLQPAELRQLADIKGHRRVEWLAVRQLVHLMSGRKTRGAFIKDQYGKPHLQYSAWHISVSHSHNIAAAIAAAVPAGVDIQYIVPKIDRLAPRYMRHEEMESLTAATRIAHLHVYWGAKEALYKAYGRRQLDFKTHILVDPFAFDLQNGRFTATLHKDGFEARFQLHYRQLGEWVLVYAVQDVGG